MKYHRVVVTQHGGPEVLQAIEEDVPEPQAGEVRVRILTAGVSALLYKRRRHKRSNAVGRPAACEMREVAAAHDQSVPALPEDRVIMP